MFNFNYKDESIKEFEIFNVQNNESFSSSIIQYHNVDLDNSNIIDEDEILNDNYSIQNYYLINQEKTEKNRILQGINSTATKTNQKKEENDEPKLCTSKDILIIFNKESNKDKISDNFKSLKFKENIEDDLQHNRRERKIEKNKYNENNKKKRGRKKEKSNKDVIHDKMCSDNIIKKIKSAIFKYSLYFLNNILISADETCSLYNIKLSRLSYKYVDELKKEKEFEILNMSLKNFF